MRIKLDCKAYSDGRTFNQSEFMSSRPSKSWERRTLSNKLRIGGNRDDERRGSHGRNLAARQEADGNGHRCLLARLGTGSFRPLHSALCRADRWQAILPICPSNIVAGGGLCVLRRYATDAAIRLGIVWFLCR